MDIADESGLNFENVSGGPKQRYIAESSSAGSAFIDFDGDGYLDLFFVNGTRFEDPLEGARNRLFRNELAGGSPPLFREVAVDLGPPGWGMGCAVGDIDNDGDADLYATYLGPNRLYRNEGEGSFEETAAEAGLADESWGASAAFGDLDGDGLLDLYVTNYVEFDLENPARHGFGCPYKGLEVFCGPGGFNYQSDRVYANAGEGRFVDKSSSTGLDRHAYPGLGVVFGDWDVDGDLDIFVANDTEPNQLFRNEGEWQLTEVGLRAGVAFSGYGRAQAGMGVHSGDFDNDGRLDLFVTNFSNDVNTLYRNEGNLRFSDATWDAGLGGVAMPYLGWSAGFIDFDNDSWLDLFAVNGHLYPQLEKHAFGFQYAQRNLLYHNTGGSFVEVGGESGAGWAIPKVSRAASAGDFDNDGDVDLLVVNLNDRPSLLRNEGGNTNDWLGLKLVGIESNRDAIGARVRVRVGELTAVREVHRSYGFQAGHDGRLLFGLGPLREEDVQVEIHWPSGRQQSLPSVPLRRYLEIREGSDELVVLETPVAQPAAPTAHEREQPSAAPDQVPAIADPDWEANDYLRASMLLYKEGRYEQVRATLEQGLALDPDSPPLRLHLGIVLTIGLERFAEGAAVLEAMVRDFPTAVDAHYYLGRSYLRMNRLDDAIQSLQQATVLHPSSWQYQNWLGLAYMRADSLEAATAALQRAAERAPWEPNPHLQLVRLYRDLGRGEDSLEQQQLFERFFALRKEVRKLEKKLKAFPGDAKVHELAVAYEKQGRLRKAIGMWEKLLRRVPEHPKARQRIRQARERLASRQ